MINEETQLEIRKFLKRLGINSQQQLNNFIENNQTLDQLKVSVNVSINEKDLFTFEDKVNITKK